MRDIKHPRPANEIAARLSALAGLFCYVAAPVDHMPVAGLRVALEDQGVGFALSGAERQIMDVPRALAHATHDDSISWKTENMWPLAWVLGFEPAPCIECRQLSADEINRPLDYAPGAGVTATTFLSAQTMRPAAGIVAMEDLFYCAHNAVRSAQLGSPTVRQTSIRSPMVAQCTSGGTH